MQCVGKSREFHPHRSQSKLVRDTRLVHAVCRRPALAVRRGAPETSEVLTNTLQKREAQATDGRGAGDTRLRLASGQPAPNGRQPADPPSGLGHLAEVRREPPCRSYAHAPCHSSRRLTTPRFARRDALSVLATKVMRRRSAAAAVAVVAVVAGGCGGSSDVVARVAGTQISRTSLRHWESIDAGTPRDAARVQGNNSRGRALSFLILASWLEAEARRQGVNVSSGQAREQLETLAWDEREHLKIRTPPARRAAQGVSDTLEDGVRGSTATDEAFDDPGALGRTEAVGGAA